MSGINLSIVYLTDKWIRNYVVIIIDTGMDQGTHYVQYDVIFYMKTIAHYFV